MTEKSPRTEFKAKTFIVITVPLEFTKLSTVTQFKKFIYVFADVNLDPRLGPN